MLTEMCAPRRGDSVERSSQWQDGGEVGNDDEVAGENHGVTEVLGEMKLASNH
jgi:hypothetical protein